MEIHKIQLGFQTVMGKNQLEITINHHYYSHVPNHQPGAMFLGISRISTLMFHVPSRQGAGSHAKPGNFNTHRLTLQVPSGKLT